MINKIYEKDNTNYGSIRKKKLRQIPNNFIYF